MINLHNWAGSRDYGMLKSTAKHAKVRVVLHSLHLSHKPINPFECAM